MMVSALELAERGKLPDALIRFGIRQRHRATLRQEHARDAQLLQERKSALLRHMAQSPIALATRAANEQHYEVPPEFFKLVLGPRLKYSSCIWPDGGRIARPHPDGLARAEEDMLEETCRRAGVRNGMRVLDLGCGWGSLSLWIAEKYPACSVLAVSNSEAQIAHVDAAARDRGLPNIEARRADMNDFEPQGVFDRITSVEMFEHMRNWKRLLGRIHGWLAPDGALFVHVFAHARAAYVFREGPSDWMGRTFFSGGMMPSDDLMLHCMDGFDLAGHWVVNGRHYRATLEAWLARLDERREEVLRLFASGSGEIEPERRLQRWRIFFMACAELFGAGGGNEWFVSHYLLRPSGGTHG
jgi:cyclopropane-fatty-acyl-phospholipid synthase